MLLFGALNPKTIQPSIPISINVKSILLEYSENAGWQIVNCKMAVTMTMAITVFIWPKIFRLKKL